MNKQKHLTLESRIIIETKLNEWESFKAIGRLLNKDCTTISQEIKNHISFEKSGAYGKSFNDCLLAFQHKYSVQKYIGNVSPSKTAIAGPVANVLLPVSLTKNMFAQNFPNRLISVMAVLNEANAHWRYICTKPLMLKRSMNWSEANPDQKGCPFGNWTQTDRWHCFAAFNKRAISSSHCCPSRRRTQKIWKYSVFLCKQRMFPKILKLTNPSV